MRTIVWFRGKDLRVRDHAPLHSAAEQGEVVPLFVLDPYFFAPERARRMPYRIQFLLESLAELAQALAQLGSELVVVQGRSVEVVPRVARQWRADRVVAHRWVEPFARERDRRVADALDVPFELFEGETLLPPGTLRTGGGGPYAIFTPFARAFRRAARIARPLPAPAALPPLPVLGSVRRVPLPGCGDLGISVNSLILAGGETAGRARLRAFLDGPVHDYQTNRDRMDLPGTSRLSADIKFGTVSVRSVWRAVERAASTTDAGRAFLNELIWREFAYSTLWDRPEVLDEPFRPGFRGFPYRDDERDWLAWSQGQTGYPIVDAAARQLLGEGFVHNRARMISASFLTKHLLLPYQLGEAHYLSTLVDGDPAQNNLGWQWSAGSGADAQPYFRVFNPVSQGAKFDPDGAYVRRWVPELGRLPARSIHAPWHAPADVLRAAGVVLGRTYPRPIVDPAEGRQRFLDVARAHLRGVE